MLTHDYSDIIGEIPLSEFIIWCIEHWYSKEIYLGLRYEIPNKDVYFFRLPWKEEFQDKFERCTLSPEELELILAVLEIPLDSFFCTVGRIELSAMPSKPGVNDFPGYVKVLKEVRSLRYAHQNELFLKTTLEKI